MNKHSTTSCPSAGSMIMGSRPPRPPASPAVTVDQDASSPESPTWPLSPSTTPRSSVHTTSAPSTSLGPRNTTTSSTWPRLANLASSDTPSTARMAPNSHWASGAARALPSTHHRTTLLRTTPLSPCTMAITTATWPSGASTLCSPTRAGEDDWRPTESELWCSETTDCFIVELFIYFLFCQKCKLNVIFVKKKKKKKTVCN